MDSPGTRVISDGWASYAAIEQRSQGTSTHVVVNHKLTFVHPQDPSIHTNHIKNMWMHTKRKLRHQFGMSEPLFGGYLFEFMWRSHFPDYNILFNNILISIREVYLVSRVFYQSICCCR